MPSTENLDTSSLERISELEEENARLRRLERIIENNLKMFDALLGTVGESITLTRADGTVIRVLRGLLGYPPGVVEGMPVETVVFPEDQHLIRESYDELRAGLERKISRELRLVKADGSLLWVELTLTDMLDNPSVMAIVNVARDLSWRRRGDLTAPQLEVLAAHTSVLLFATGLEGSIEGWNGAVAHATGYTPGEVTGHHVSLLLPQDTLDSDRAMRSAIIESGERSQRFGSSLRRRNGTLLPVQLTLAPLVADNAIRGVAYLAQPATEPRYL